MSKTLSNGVMSLKFMQNAQRAKEQEQVELEQAKIKDEAEWEVSQEVKDAWGIGPSSIASASVVVHEASYLPFLFPSTVSDVSDNAQAIPKGRRSFNAKGKEAEIVAEQRASEIQQSNNVQGSQRSSIRLTSISGFKSPLNTKSSPKASQGSKNKTVQELIREDVGKRPPSSLRTDRASSPVSAQHASGTIPAGFLKPSGVDGPRASLRNRSSSAEHSAPSKKRDRDDAGDAEGKKRRKKKDKVIGARMID